MRTKCSQIPCVVHIRSGEVGLPVYHILLVLAEGCCTLLPSKVQHGDRDMIGGEFHQRRTMHVIGWSGYLSSCWRETNLHRLHRHQPHGDVLGVEQK
jgi:hypothetical protein